MWEQVPAVHSPSEVETRKGTGGNFFKLDSQHLSLGAPSFTINKSLPANGLTATVHVHVVSNITPCRWEAKGGWRPHGKWRGSLHKSKQLDTCQVNISSLGLLGIATVNFFFFKLQTGIGQRRETPNHPSSLKQGRNQGGK